MQAATLLEGLLWGPDQSARVPGAHVQARTAVSPGKAPALSVHAVGTVQPTLTGPAGVNVC